MTSLTKHLAKRRALLAKRAEIDAEIAQIEAEIFPRIESLAAAFEGQVSPPPPQPTRRVEKPRDAAVVLPGPQAAPAPKRQLADEIEDVLRSQNRPMKTTEILSVLKLVGVPVAGKVPQNTLSAHLAHHKGKRFNRLQDGWVIANPELEGIEKPNAQAHH